MKIILSKSNVQDVEYVNKNILQSDRGLQVVDRAEAASIRCPHCLHVGSFSIATAGLGWTKLEKVSSMPRADGPPESALKAMATSGHIIQGFLRVCPNPKCNGVVFTLSNGREVIQVLPPELIDFDGSNLPLNLLATLEEAIACHAAGAYRASAMMVRRLLEEICAESDAKGKDLHDRLAALRSKITLPEELFDAMGELKALGNDAAHIAARNYASIGKNESEDSIELAKEILKARYQLKGLVERLRARRSKSQE